jgi:hypothetical protein
MKTTLFLLKTLVIPFLLFYEIAHGQANTPLVLDGPPLAAAVRTADENRRYEQLNQFLQNTGFPDLPASIAKTLSGPNAQSLEQINRETLESNWHRLQIVNFARDLAAELLTALTPTLGDPQSAAKTAELAARLLSQKRLAIPDAFPDAVRNIKNYDQRVAAKEQFLNGAIEKNIIRMQEQIVSDSLHTIFGRSKIESVLNGRDLEAKNKMTAYIRRLDTLANRYVRSLYFDHEMGLGHWLGEAMALGLVHTSRLSKDSEVRKFEALLNNRAYAYGEYLSDAVSDTLTFVDENGQRKQVKIKQADTVTELYSEAQGSRLSAAAVRPHILNRWKALRGKLLQSFVFAAVTSDESKKKWDAIDGKEPSLISKIQQTLSESAPAKVGSSHAGMAAVFKNEQSGVAITRTIDMYAFGPMPYGGTRFITTKSIFASPGIFANFGVSSLNPELTLDYLQKLTHEKGLEPVFKVSDVYRPDQSGKLVKSPGETFAWTPRISEDDQRKIMDVKREDAEKWYTKDLAPRLVAEMFRFITDYGMAFRTYGEDKPNKWACYCSEGVNIAGYRETGHNLQSHPDKLYFLGRLARFFYPKLESKVYREIPVAPNFMAWDPKTETKTVRYAPRSAVENWAEQSQSARTDFDPALTASLAKFTDRTMKYSDMQIGQARYSPISMIENVEASVVRNPNRPDLSIFAPRENPMGVSTSEAPVLTYNPVPPSEAKAAIVSDQDLRTRQAVHETLIKAANYANESSAAGYILAEIYPRLKDPGTLSLFQAFTAKMMALKPINPPRLIPPEIKSLPANERDLALSKYLNSFITHQIETHTRQILSDITGILYGKDVVERVAKKAPRPGEAQIGQKINELYKLIGAEVKRVYLDPGAADARAFGTNLAIGLVNVIVKSDKPQDIAKLNESLKTYGLQTQDFFGADLNSAKVQTALRMGEVKTLQVRLNPGQKLRERLSQPVKGRALRKTELAQLRYSPYAEVQPELTRSLDAMFSSKPLFSSMTLTPVESRSLFARTVNEYILPINQDQMGKNGDLYTSEFLRANPVAPERPSYSQTLRACPGMFAK